MGYRFNTKSGDDGMEEFVEIPGESYPRRKFNRRVLALTGMFVILCTAIAVGVGVHVSGKTKRAEEQNQPKPTTINTTIDTTTTPAATTTTTTTTTTTVETPTTTGLNEDRHPLLLIAIGHFGADYLQRNATGYLQQLSGRGATAQYMQSVFPTLSTPNLYSIVTGLYPESHGITSNVMSDPDIKDNFDATNVSSTLNPKWWTGEPVWVKIAKKGKKSVSFGWPGSKVNISGVIPDRNLDPGKNVPTSEAVQQIVELLNQSPATRPQLVTWYIEDLVTVSHTYGPHSPLVDDSLKVIDAAIESLMVKLRSLSLHNTTNIIIVSDHGVLKTSPELTVPLPESSITDSVRHMQGTTAATITWTTHSHNDSSQQTQYVNDLQCLHSHLKVFTKASAPQQFRFLNNPRAGDVYVTTTKPWMFKPKSGFSLGSSGYDAHEENMKALFIGIGPDFQPSLEIEPFENVELYNMMCALLGVEPNPNNGTEGRLEEVLTMGSLQLTSTASPANPTHTPTLSSVSSNPTQKAKLNPENLNQAEASKEPIFSEQIRSLLGSSMEHVTLCEFLQGDYVVAVDRNTERPLWTAFTINNQTLWNHGVNASGYKKECESVADQLADWNQTLATLPQNSSEGHSELGAVLCSSDVLTNSSAMNDSFRNGIWKFLCRTINQYGNQGTVTVLTGPVFDLNYDGHADNMTQYHHSNVSPPTHYFAVVQRTPNTKSTKTSDVLSFVLPHLPQVTNCMNFADYLRDNIVNVRAIERLTLLNFNQILTMKQRTFTPTDPWPSSSTLPWIQQQECPQRNTCERNPVLLLLSLHNFGTDNLDLVKMPALEKLKRCGVHAPSMRPVYPYKSLPNLYSIVTGLYPESHGIVDEEMYDPAENQSFPSTSHEKFWWQGEPIWKTAESQNKTSSVHLWPGFRNNMTGETLYKSPTDYIKVIHKILDDLSGPLQQLPHLIAAFLPTPDPALNIEDHLQQVNGAINHLMDGIKDRELLDCVNMVLVSDHGNKVTSLGRLIDLSAHLQVTLPPPLKFGGEAARIDTRFIKAGDTVVPQSADLSQTLEADLYSSLSNVSDHIRVFNHETLPYHYHYTHHPRIGNLVIVPDPGWAVITQSSEVKQYKLNFDLDNSEQALFLASGPSFINNKNSATTADAITETFDNIELYNMMADLLDIKPAPNNGTLGSLRHILTKNLSLVEESPTQTNYTECKWAPVASSCPKLLPDQPAVGGSVAPSSLPQESRHHLPFGVPHLKHRPQHQCLDFSEYFVLEMESHQPMPAWVSATFNKTSNSSSNSSSSISHPLPHPACSRYDNATLNLTTGYLLPYNTDDDYSKTSVPMFEEFKNGTWVEVWNLIRDYTTMDTLNVVIGTVWQSERSDTEYTSGSGGSGGGGGSGDPSAQKVVTTTTTAITTATAATTKVSPDQISSFTIPSHFYVIVSKCSSDTGELPDCKNSTEILSLIIPHTKYGANLKNPRKYLDQYRCRLRDIETLVDARFLTKLPESESVRLRTSLSESLWEGGERASSWRKSAFCKKIDYSRCKNTSSGPTLIFVSLDGFRASYVNKNVTPVINRLRECGTDVPYMKPVYPSKTFPNHFTMATGLYPESHGIIANRMFDIKLKKIFRTKNTEDYWWNATPIWKTLKDNGVKTAALYPGNNVPKNRPDHYENYSPVKSFEDNMDKAVAWIKDGVRFVALYFEQPDASGHRRGPNSAKVIKALQSIDSIIGSLMDKLYEEQLEHCVDIVIVADHGMAEISLERIVALPELLSEPGLHQVMESGSLVRISTRYRLDGYKVTVFTNDTENQVSEEALMSDLSCQSPYMDVYPKRSLPKVLHYANNRRIEDIIVLPQDKWFVAKDMKYNSDKGSHGYDNRFPSMRSLFLAYGPHIKQNLTIQPFENIELFNLFADIFNVTAPPNNGTKGRLDVILRSPPSREKVNLTGGYIRRRFNTTERQLTQFLNSSECSSMSVSPQTVKDLMVLLNDSDPEAPTQGTKTFGLPASNVTASLLWHTTHVTVYNPTLPQPLFIAATLNGHNNTLEMEKSNDKSCSLPDPRLPSPHHNTTTCPPQITENLTWMNLYPAGLMPNISKTVLRLSSSCVPVPYNFMSGLWMEASHKISDWLKLYTEVNIFSGPIFDYDIDGRADSLETIRRFSPESVPSHVFLVLASWDNTTSQLGNSTAYILPTHHPANQSCFRSRAWSLNNHKARIRDIELLTNLEFFPEMPFQESVIARTTL